MTGWGVKDGRGRGRRRGRRTRRLCLGLFLCIAQSGTMMTQLLREKTFKQMQASRIQDPEDGYEKGSECQSYRPCRSWARLRRARTRRVLWRHLLFILFTHDRWWGATAAHGRRLRRTRARPCGGGGWRKGALARCWQMHGLLEICSTHESINETLN